MYRKNLKNTIKSEILKKIIWYGTKNKRIFRFS